MMLLILSTFDPNGSKMVFRWDSDFPAEARSSMSPTVTNQHTAEEKSRLVLINLAGLTMRMMENWRRGTADILGRMPDYDTIMIVGAIIGIGGEKLVREKLEAELQTLANHFP